MTACVNKHTKRVAAVVTASLVGALSLGVAPVAAMATDGVETLADPSSVWDGIEFTWNVEADPVNGYAVELGDSFKLDGAKDAFGNPVSMSDLTVLYFKDSATDGVQGEFSNYDAACTSKPEEAGIYFAVVVNGRVDSDSISGWKTFESNIKDKYQYEVVTFTVEAKSLKDAYAFEGDDASDTNFKYTGNKKIINFADAAGNKLTIGSAKSDENDAVVKSIYKVGDQTTNYAGSNITEAGKYVATLEGVNDYKGSSEAVEFTVDKIDLSKDVVTIDPIVKGSVSSTPNNTDLVFYVNGEKVNSNIFMIKEKSVTGYKGDDKLPGYDWASRATVVAEVYANEMYGTNANNFVDSKYKDATATFLVVDYIVDNYYYDNALLADANGDGVLELTIDSSKGQEFNPALISAAHSADTQTPLHVDVTVARDGEKTEDYTTPGTLIATVDVETPKDLEYAGTKTIKVAVLGKHYNSKPMVFAAVDGKDANGAEIEYDAEAVEPVVVAKSGSSVIDAADYTVTYKDADGNVVDSIIEPGEYTSSVDFGNATWGIHGAHTTVDPVTFTFTVTKAQLRSAKADKDVYAYTGQAVTPVFTAYNEGDLEGLSLEIDPAKTGVSYFELEVDKKTGKPKEYDGIVDDTYPEYIDVDGDGRTDYKTVGTVLKASDLKDEGYYVAELTAPADDAHFQGQVYSVPFQISEYAAFSDVDASAWYADAVYNAADLGYMTGISGTDLFMPMADITRAELAKVFGNMAGKAFSPIYTPTKFDDVDPLAWYAGAVAWADEAGIVTGYDDVTFGPSDKATREQVAVMLYRYAAGQGKDVTVDDVEGTLAAYTDGDQVSDWAKTAMAWAVENGVFGQGTDELWAKQNIQRCAVATIAVRFQPEALPEA